MKPGLAIITSITTARFFIIMRRACRLPRAYIQAKGDPIADLYEDIAAEEKARATYQWLIDISDDPDLNDSLRFLREREIVHSMRFREAVEILKEERDKKKIF